MARRSRAAVSTYIEVFILMAVVLGGSTLVYAAAMGLAYSSQSGASVQVTGAAIEQGEAVAVETVTIANTGTVSVSSMTLTTAGAATSGSFYLSLLNPSTGSTISSGCGAGTNPASVPMCFPLPAGQSVIATLTVEAQLFAVGARYTVIVSASPPAEAAVQVVAASA
ncbi:MAG TPA: hypothetical protein VLY21_05715 [Nitrososphaerales archaeon]|nr:hypothetical protein [Nitrososphaerales archaeon]